MVSRYIHDENLKRFKRLLLTETDPKKRAILTELLANERANVGLKLGAAPANPAGI